MGRAEKKRKSPAVEADCNARPDVVDPLQKTKPGGAKTPIVNSGGAGGGIRGDSNPVEDRKSDTVSQSSKTEATPSTSGNRSKADKRRRQKLARKLRESVSIDVDLSLSRPELHIPETGLVGEKRKSPAVEADCNAHPDAVDPLQETKPGGAKKRRRKTSVLNAGSDCNLDKISEESSAQVSTPKGKGNVKVGGEIRGDRKSDTVSQALKTEATPSTKADRRRRQRLARKLRKSLSLLRPDGSSHHDTELPDSKVAGQSIPVDNGNGLCSSEAPSISSGQSMERDAKESGKSKKRKQSKMINSSISNVDSTCNSSGINGSADKLNQSCMMKIALPALCGDQSMEDNAKEIKKSKRKKKSKKGNSSILNDDSKHNPDGNNFCASEEAREPEILDQSSMIEIAPSTLCDQIVEHEAKERKKPKKIKKSKKRNSSISNADSSCNPDQQDAEVSKMQRKDSDKSGGSQINTEVVDGIVSYDSNIASQSPDIETAPSTVCNQSKKHNAEKKRRKKSSKINGSIPNAQSKCDPDPISSGEISSYVSSEPKDVILATFVVKAAGHSNRKLLILDLNGLLADVSACPTPGYKPNAWVSRKAVFKRPYCDDFLQFCLETFDVGVWSSRMRKNVDGVVQCLMGGKRNQLVFCWDASHCTRTGCKTLENSEKPLVLKELKKLWEKLVPGLPWKKGTYDESNTLLIDDSPYKALRNPPYTCIFPNPYVHTNTKDNSLGPDGDLRLYLKRLAAADSVETFVKENPFGQSPITNSDPSWTFYSRIIKNTR